MAGVRTGITSAVPLRNNGMSGIELGRTLHTVVFSDCQAGLGIKVIGGIAEDDEDDRDFGIFIKKVLFGGVAALDGRLQEGDQLIEVNGQNLERVTNEEAVQGLRLASASDYIQLVICRDLQTREEYMELLNNYSYSSASSVYEQTSPRDMSFHGSKDTLGVPEGRAQSSRSITPTNHIRTPKSPMQTPRLSPNKGVGESSSGGSEMDYASPRLRPNSSPPYHVSHYAPTDLPGTHSLSRVAKVPSAAAASMQGLLAPSLASTPQQFMGSVPNMKSSPPDGASGAPSVHSHMMYEPSPVINTSDPNSFQPGLLLSDMSYGMDASRQEPDYSNTSLSRKLSLDFNMKLPVGKLEVALRYLGLEPTPEQRTHLRRKLTVGSEGMVAYGNFVRVARDVFRVELQQKNVTPAAFYLASPNISHTSPQDNASVLASQQGTVQRDTSVLEQELLRVQKDKERLSREVDRLKALLKEKEDTSFVTDDEVHRLQKEVQSAQQENRAMKTKVHLAEQAQRAARRMEQDYAEVIRLLEKEVAQLKTQTKHEKPPVHKRLAVLGCQLRKAEVSKKTYEVATEKLLKLAELVIETISGEGEAHTTLNTHSRLSNSQLAAKAKDTILAVRSLLEAEPM